MRRILIILAAVVVAIVILLVAGASLINVDRFRPKIQAELQSKLGRPVTLGTLHLHLIPFSVQVDGLTIAEASQFNSQQPFAQAQQVFASADLFSLIKGQPEIHELTLRQPKIELIRDAAGQWNYSTLGNQAGTSAPASSTGTASNQPSGLTLSDLKIEDGQVAITDQRAHARRTVYNHIDLTLTGFAPGKAFDIDAAVHFSGPGKELLSFRGKAGPLATSSSQLTPVSGHVSLDQISLAGINSVRPDTVPANTDASASGAADIASQNGSMTAQGNLTLADATFQGQKAAYPITARYDLAMTQANDLLNIRSGTIGMGPTNLALAGTVNQGASPAAFNLKVGTKNASIADLSRIASLFGVAFDANDQIKGDLSADLAVTGNASLPQIQGVLSSSHLQAQEIALTNLRANASMKDGVVQLAPVTAGIFGGQEDGNITLQTKAAHPLCSVKAKLTGVDANALLSSVSSVKNTLYGSLASNADLSFAIDSSTNLAGTLNGTVAFNLANGQLKNVNVLNEVSRIGKFLNGSAVQQGPNTQLQKFSGTLDIKQGVASTNNLVAVVPEGSLSAAGTINLASQALDMHLSAVLSNGASKSAGGNGVGGFLNTALANGNGELVVPVIVTGTASHPAFAPDVQAMAKMKLNHLLPTTGNPTTLTKGLLGGVLGQATGQNTAQGKDNGQAQQNPLNSILGQFGKKKH